MDTVFVENTAFQSRNAYTLSQLDVYNWGPFDGRKGAQIDPKGTAIIGPTGSGKTTLVDALMTLLSAQPKYNLASTGGHESDRDLVSYVRGFSGAGNASGDNEHIARPGKTITAISACFQQEQIDEVDLLSSSTKNGPKNQLTIAAIFWIEGSSSSATDLKKLWIFSTHDSQQQEPALDVYDWLEMHQASGARGLKQWARNENGVQVFDSKKSYLAQLKRFFEVGDNAFTLLNRAAGLKQLNSIDEIFRELVLDDHSAFERAAEVAEEFNDLAEIHNELEIARQQKNSLLPIESEYKKYQQALKAQQDQRLIINCLPNWYAHHAHELWVQRCAQLQHKSVEAEQQVAEFSRQVKASEIHRDNLHSHYLQVGGNNIEQLQNLIDAKNLIVAERQRHIADYQNLVSKFQLDKQITRVALQANQVQAKNLSQDCQQNIQQAKEQELESGFAYKQLDNDYKNIKQEYDAAIASPDSNIPYQFQNFRQQLAEVLNLRVSDLPYVAELIEVKAEFSSWRGAIERAVGGHRLRLLVPPHCMAHALSWINQRHNRLHVRLLEAKEEKSSQFFDDGFARKLNYKTHTLISALKYLMAGIDRHCVAHSDDLQHTSHSMTEQGLMSGKAGYYEKQDQKSIEQGWITGFDNQDSLAELKQQLDDIDPQKKLAEQKYQDSQQQLTLLNDRLILLTQLENIEFEQLDIEAIQAEIDSHKTSLHALLSPNSDAEQAHKSWQDAKSSHLVLVEQLKDHEVGFLTIKNELDQADRQRQRSFNRIGQGLTEAEWQLANAILKIPQLDQLEEIDEHERAASKVIQGELNKLNSTVAESENKLGKFMMTAQRVDTGALVESGTELQDIQAYLDRLVLLTEEALPEKLKRFIDYLNHSSDQGVTQLLSHIENEVAVIEERIEDLNETMRRVDFQPQRYLRLDPQRIVHESLRTLQQAQRYLRSAALENDDGESHYKALDNLVSILRDASDRKKTVAARALLDPRYRLQFAVSVIDRLNGHVIETRTGSQGGSGGEKEIIASYILTASLSYALCPDGASKPLFGTIVLDEAFSKSSQAVAGRIISALREFGLHPLFITPNKEMRLLRAHTRSAILIHRRGLSATMTSLSWDELENQAKKRLSV